MLNFEMIDKLDQGILLLDKDQKILFVNKFFLKRIKYEQICGWQLSDVLLEGHDAKAYSIEELDGKELIFKNKENRKYKVKVSITKEEEYGQGSYWLTVKRWQDIETVGRELGEILDYVPYAIWIENLEGDYLYANLPYVNEASAILKTKLTKEDIKGLNAEMLWKERFDRNVWREDTNNVLNERAVNEIRYLEGEDSILPYVITKFPIKDEDGKITKIACVKDNSAQRKRAQEVFVSAYGKKKQTEMISIIENDLDSYLKGIDEREENCGLGAEMMVLFDYDNKEKQLKAVSSMSNINVDLSSMRMIKMEEDTFRQHFGESKIFARETYEKEQTGIDLTTFFAEDIKYVAQYPISYLGELLGVIIACYKRESGLSAINKKEINRLCSNLALTIKNIKLVEQCEKEFVLREKAENTVQDLFGTTIGLYSVYDLKKRQCIINMGWEDVLGWGDGDVDDEQVIYEVDRQDVLQRMMNVAREKKEEQCVSRFNKRDGGYRWIKWKAKPALEGNAITMFGLDVTEEIEVAEQCNAFHKALEIETSKSEFIANMSHELKTPLNVLYNTIQMMEIMNHSKMDYETYLKNADVLKKYAKVMQQNVFRLLRLVNNIIDSAQIGEGSYTPKLQNCNFVEVVEDITQAVIDYTRERTGDIIFDTDVEELEMACDIEKIERMILNLLSNAIKYSSDDSEIEVKMSVEGDIAVIYVSDEGIGIPKEKQQDIFEQFMLVDHSFTRQREGSGIGLALVKSIVEMHKGTIIVNSELGKGTTFCIRLPIYQISEEEQREGLRKLSAGRSSIEKCRIEFSDIYEMH